MLGLALFADAASHTILLPLSPYIAHSFYPDLSWKEVGYYSGYLIGAGYIGNAFSFTIWEYISDLYGRKRVILFGLTVIATGLIALGLCNRMFYAILIRLFMGVFNGVSPAARAHIPEVCSVQPQRVLSTAWNVGLIVGPGMSGVVYFFTRRIDLSHENNVARSYFISLFFGSVFALMALVANCIGLKDVVRTRPRQSYSTLEADDEEETENTMLEMVPTPSVRRIFSTDANSIPDTDPSSIWRREMQIETILDRKNSNFEKIRQLIPHYFHKRSEVSGNVVFYELIGSVDFKALLESDLTTLDIELHYVYLMELWMKKMASEDTQQLICVVDLQGLSIKNVRGPAAEIFYSVIDLLQKQYRNALAKLVLANEPFWFSFVWANMTSRMDQVTNGKIIRIKEKSLLQQYLRELVGVNSLPVQYGGTDAIAFGQSSEENLIQATTNGSDSSSDSDSDSFDCAEFDEENPSKIVRKISGVALKELAKEPTTRTLLSIASENAQTFTSSQVSKLVIVFCAWSFVQASCTELYALWSINRRAEGDHTFSSASIGGTLSAMAFFLQLVELYGCPNQLTPDWTPLTQFRLGVLFQIPLFVLFPLISEVTNNWINWSLIMMALVSKQYLRNMAFRAILMLLDNSVQSQQRSILHRLAISFQLFARGFGCIISPSIFSLAATSGGAYPFDQALSYYFIALIQFVVLIVSMTFPKSINSPRLHFLQ